MGSHPLGAVTVRDASYRSIEIRHCGQAPALDNLLAGPGNAIIAPTRRECREDQDNDKSGAER
jgi:hypothetical protein